MRQATRSQVETAIENINAFSCIYICQDSRKLFKPLAEGSMTGFPLNFEIKGALA